MSNKKPIPDQTAPKPMGPPKNGVRLFQDDNDSIILLVKSIKECNIKIDSLDIIRECVMAGLPSVQERWNPIIEAAKKVR